MTDLSKAAVALSRITASKLDLAFECLHWTTIKLPADRSGRSASIMGQPFHQNVALGAHAEQLDDDHEEWLSQERFQGWLERGRRLLPARYRQEIAYCLTPDGTVTELGENLDRDYAGAMLRLGIETGLCGTLDVVSDEEIDDFKTGRRLKPARDAWQLRFGAVVTGARKRAFHYIDAAGDVAADAHTATTDEIEADRKRLVVLMKDVIEGRTEAIPGEHCASLYCPARKTCSAHQDFRKQQETTMGRMTLKNITKGRLESPLSVLVYGTEGIGKSTFATNAPSPIVLDPDGGTEQLDVARFPKPDSWEECLEALDTLVKEAHEHKTFVLDTADALEALIFAAVCRNGSKKGIEDFGYGKGYTAAIDLWREFLKRLDALRGRGMHVVLLAHAHVKTFQNPAGDDYDRYRLKLHDKSAALLKEWPAAVLFANYRTLTREKDGKVRASGDGSRIVYTEHRPAWDAKNRYGLPFELPLDWTEFESAARAGEPASIEALRGELAETLKSADAKLTEQTTAAMGRCGSDVRKLSQLLDWLKGKLQAGSTGATEAA